MADEDQQKRTIPHHVMARHFQGKADMLEGMAITRLADQAALEGEVEQCHRIIAKLKEELQTAQETIAQRDEEITRLDAQRTADDLNIREADERSHQE